MAQPLPPPTRRYFFLAVLGLLLALAGLPLYALLLDVPLLRRTGVPALALAGLGAAFAVVAVRHDRRRRVQAVLGVTLLVLVALVWGLFLFARLPAPGDAVQGDRAADFTLPDQDGRAVTLSEECVKGPVLLAFFRGRW